MAMRAKRKAIRPEEFENGVPNRDLDEEEYQAMDPELRKRVRESGLYDVKTDAEMAGSSPPKTSGKDGD